jgi:hypothetical protein
MRPLADAHAFADAKPQRGGSHGWGSQTLELRPSGARQVQGCGCVEVRWPKAEIELPFVHPKIFVKYLLSLKSFSFSTRGWKDSAR